MREPIMTHSLSRYLFEVLRNPAYDVKWELAQRLLYKATAYRDFEENSKYALCVYFEDLIRDGLPFAELLSAYVVHQKSFLIHVPDGDNFPFNTCEGRKTARDQYHEEVATGFRLNPRRMHFVHALVMAAGACISVLKEEPTAALSSHDALAIYRQYLLGYADAQTARGFGRLSRIREAFREYSAQRQSHGLCSYLTGQISFSLYPIFNKLYSERIVRSCGSPFNVSIAEYVSESLNHAMTENPKRMGVRQGHDPYHRRNHRGENP